MLITFCSFELRYFIIIWRFLLCYKNKYSLILICGANMVKDKLVCHACKKEFCSVSTKNRHIKNIHHENVEKKKSIHIKCPLCPKEHKLPFANYEDLIKHLNDDHGIVIKNSILNFRNIQEFEFWRRLESKVLDYRLHRTNKKRKNVECRYYNCNRSDSKGFVSTCKQRKMKSCGSIKMSGVCPSRILVKIFENGMVTVKFTETHVGHGDDLRSKILTENQQHLIGEQLLAGVTHEKIIQNARMIKDNKFEQRSETVSDHLDITIKSSEKDKEEDVLIIDEPFTSQNTNQQNLKLFLEETDQTKTNDINLKRQREIEMDEIFNYITNLDDKNFEEFKDMVKKHKNKNDTIHVKEEK